MREFEEIIFAAVRAQMNIQEDDKITLEFLNGIEYEQSKYREIEHLFLKRDIPAIKSLSSEGSSGISDNLLVYQLKQKGMTDRLVVVLDKFDLWSNPSVLSIF